MIEPTQQVFEQKIQAIMESVPVAKKHNIASWKVSLALLTVPPLGFYLMWKDKTYHSWFGWLNWTFGAFLILYFLFLNYFLVPQINKMLTAAGNTMVSIGIWDWILVFGFGLAQFSLGFVFRYINKRDGELKPGWLVLAIIFLAVDYIVPTMIYSKIMAPIYSSILGQ